MTSALVVVLNAVACSPYTSESSCVQMVMVAVECGGVVMVVVMTVVVVSVVVVVVRWLWWC